MLKNYFKITLRNLFNHKTTSLISILSLVAGMVCSILIAIYIQHELSFDKFNKNSDRIYRLVLERKTAEGISTDIASPPPLAKALTSDYPQIKSVRFLNIDNPLPLVSSGENRFYEKQFYFADPDIFNVFTVPFIIGNPQSALSKPNSTVITERVAEKYFGKTNPIGKTLTFNNFLELEVTGIVKNLPSNSTLNFDFLVSFSTIYGWLGKDFVDNWQNNMCQTFVLLPNQNSYKTIKAQLPEFLNRHIDKSNNLKQVYLQPLNRIHLYSFEDYKLASGGDINFVNLLTAIAVFVLLIACFNYISLTTSQFVRRSKEIGVRKLIGASRKQLVSQFFGEGLFLTVIALLASLILVLAVVPYFNRILGLNLELNLSGSFKLMIIPSIIILLIGLLSSIYPAFFLSSFQPLSIIRARLKNVNGKIVFRKILVSAQFGLTIFLVVGTSVVYKQLDYIQNKQLGFNDENVIVVPIREAGLRQNPQPLENRLMQFAGVKHVGAAALLPGGPVGKTKYQAQGVQNIGTMSMLWVDFNFIKTLGMKLTAGRGFSKEFANDANESFVINEEAVKQLGWQTPHNAIGKTFEIAGGKKGKIIGVVKDFNFTSLQSKIEPIVLHIWPWMNYFLVRTDANHLPSVIIDLKNIWNEYEPDNPFEYSLLNDNFNRYYESINRLEKVSMSFTFIAILIACLGLFALSAFSSISRTKEIGIRKVLGASLYSILRMQLHEFFVLVLIACLIAGPLAYFAMTNWLQNYAYRIDIGFTTLIPAFFVSFSVALLTVGYHAIKSAIANPTKSLKYE